MQQEHDLQRHQTGATTARNGMDLRNWLMEERRDWNSKLSGRQGAESWINQEVIDSFVKAKTAHNDFAALLPTMEIISDAVKPDWARLTVAEYVESLYAIAKYASFAVSARAALPAPPPQP